MTGERFSPRSIEGDANDDYVLTTVGGVAMWMPAASMPAGGSTDQVLTKQSGADYDAAWETLPVAEKQLAFKANRTLTAAVGTTRYYNDSSVTWTILSIRASVETAPSGGSVVIDVNKNGTTLFTTQANRPTITTGNLTSGKVTNMNVTSVAPGDYLTVDVDTATTPSANLTVILVIQ